VAESYMGYFERFIEQHRLSDLFVFSPSGENDSCGVGFPTLSRDLLPEGREYLRRWWQYKKVTRSVQGNRRQFERTGLLVAASDDASILYQEASKVVSAAIFGEIIPTVGKGLQAISEALPKPLCDQSGMPILSYESDGYPVSPTFLRQVDVHVHQVLKRWQTRHSLLQYEPS